MQLICVVGLLLVQLLSWSLSLSLPATSRACRSHQRLLSTALCASENNNGLDNNVPVSSRDREIGKFGLRFATATGVSLLVSAAFDQVLKAAASGGGYPVYGDESIMSKKEHGTASRPVQDNLRWSVDRATADRICCFNRRFAEYAGYWQSTKFLSEVDRTGETTYYDSVTGKPLFIAPRGRSFKDWENESVSHGWPSFRGRCPTH
jgi:hypothetical protein